MKTEIEKPDDIPDFPELPPGIRAVYRGKGWTNDGKPCEYICYEETGWWPLGPVGERIPDGTREFHYAELVPDPMKIEKPDDLPDFPELPTGIRAVYRGKGWNNDGKPCEYICYKYGAWWPYHGRSNGTPDGCLYLHYAELVPDKPTTVKGWLETLPDGYRERALRNMDMPEKSVPSLAEAIWRGFTWGTTTEGLGFWDGVRDHYTKETPLPPLPDATTDWVTLVHEAVELRSRADALDKKAQALRELETINARKAELERMLAE